MKTCPVRAEFFLTDEKIHGQTDGYDEANRRFSKL
jgi:hypothetical protein